MSTEMVVVATSSPKNRPEYLADLLDCLAYPDGHTAAFSYRFKWIDPGIVFSASEQGSLPGLVVYCAQVPGSDEFTFYPLRHVTVLGFEPLEVLKKNQQDLDTYVSVQLRLGPCVQVSPRAQEEQWTNWSRWIAGAKPRPFPQNRSRQSFCFKDLARHYGRLIDRWVNAYAVSEIDDEDVEE